MEVHSWSSLPPPFSPYNFTDHKANKLSLFFWKRFIIHFPNMPFHLKMYLFSLFGEINNVKSHVDCNTCCSFFSFWFELIVTEWSPGIPEFVLITIRNLCKIIRSSQGTNGAKGVSGNVEMPAVIKWVMTIFLSSMIFSLKKYF